MLKLNNVSTSYGPIKVLRRVNLEVRQGQITCLLGSNGAGKTTTIKTILGLVKPYEGEVIFKGRRIDQLNTAQIIELGVAVVPEGRRVFPKMSVYENLLIGNCCARDKENPDNKIKEIYRLFPRLEERKNQTAGTLSGGEQQMLAIGRALMSRPELLLLDEPSLGLAPILIKEIFNIIKKINESGTTVLLIEQNAFQALNIAHHAYFLQKGEVITEQQGQEGLNKEKIRELYLTKKTQVS